MWPYDRWKPCSCRGYRRWRTCYCGDEVRRVESMSQSTIAIFLTNCEKYRSKMLLELSIIILESCLPPPLPVVHTRNGIEWAKMLPTYPCIRTFPCKMPWCLMPAQATKKFPKEIPFDCSCPSVDENMIKNKCVLIVAYTFCPLKRNHFTELVEESLKVLLKTQQSLCDHWELLPVGKGSCYAF